MPSKLRCTQVEAIRCRVVGEGLFYLFRGYIEGNAHASTRDSHPRETVRNWTYSLVSTNMGAASLAAQGVPGRLVGVLTDPCHRSDQRMTPDLSAPDRALRRSRFSEPSVLPDQHGLPLGTNGYVTSWGTNAHGELSACPPGPV